MQYVSNVETCPSVPIFRDISEIASDATVPKLKVIGHIKGHPKFPHLVTSPVAPNLKAIGQIVINKMLFDFCLFAEGCQ